MDLSGGRGWLQDDAAKNIMNYVDPVAVRELGRVLQITSAGRTYAEQAALYAAYLNGSGNLAAPPGTSVHESGLAIDTNDATWLRSHPEFGWVNTGLGFSEPWHFEYQGGAALAGGPINPIPVPKEDDMPSLKELAELAATPFKIRAAYRTLLNRDATDADIAGWLPVAVDQGWDFVEQWIGKSPEALTADGTEDLAAAVGRLFQQDMGRAASPQDVVYYTDMAEKQGLDAVHRFLVWARAQGAK